MAKIGSAVATQLKSVIKQAMAPKDTGAGTLASSPAELPATGNGATEAGKG